MSTTIKNVVQFLFFYLYTNTCMRNTHMSTRCAFIAQRMHAACMYVAVYVRFLPVYVFRNIGILLDKTHDIHHNKVNVSRIRITRAIISRWQARPRRLSSSKMFFVILHKHTKKNFFVLDQVVVETHTYTHHKRTHIHTSSSSLRHAHHK